MVQKNILPQALRVYQNPYELLFQAVYHQEAGGFLLTAKIETPEAAFR